MSHFNQKCDISEALKPLEQAILRIINGSLFHCLAALTKKDSLNTFIRMSIVILKDRLSSLLSALLASRLNSSTRRDLQSRKED